MRQVRHLPAIALSLTFAVTSSAHAQSGGLTVKLSGPDSVAHIVERADPARANFAIVTKDGTGALVLLDTTIVAQLTERGLDKMKAKAATDSIKGVGERLFARMVLGALQPMFDHGIAYHLRDLSTAEYADGRLQLRRRNGEEVFRDVKVNNTPLMESFSEADAKLFASKARDARVRLTK